MVQYFEPKSHTIYNKLKILTFPVLSGVQYCKLPAVIIRIRPITNRKQKLLSVQPFKLPPIDWHITGRNRGAIDRKCFISKPDAVDGRPAIPTTTIFDLIALDLKPPALYQHFATMIAERILTVLARHVPCVDVSQAGLQADFPCGQQSGRRCGGTIR